MRMVIITNYAIKTVARIIMVAIMLAGCGEGMTRFRYFEYNGKRTVCGGKMYGGGVQIGKALLFDGEASQVVRDEKFIQERLAEGYKEVPEISVRR